MTSWPTAGLLVLYRCSRPGRSSARPSLAAIGRPAGGWPRWRGCGGLAGEKGRATAGVALKVEMAGIEPASGRVGARTSTSVAGCLLRLGRPTTGKGRCSEAAAGLTRRAAASPARHPDFVPPTPAPVGVRGRGTGSRLVGSLPRYCGIKPQRAGQRQECARHFLCSRGFYEVAHLGSPSGTHALPSNPCIPMCTPIIPPLASPARRNAGLFSPHGAVGEVVGGWWLEAGIMRPPGG